MSAVVVDTNVAIVANDVVLPPNDEGRRPLDCIEACIDALSAITKGSDHLVLDELGFIFEEYRRCLSFAGQPGPGDVFMKWVHERQWDPARCTRVEITPDDGRVFVEFPDSPDLTGFHNDDRKFVAVAAAHPDHPVILQAVDWKWRDWADALAKEGLAVRFLCSRGA